MVAKKLVWTQIRFVVKYGNQPIGMITKLEGMDTKGNYCMQMLENCIN